MRFLKTGIYDRVSHSGAGITVVAEQPPTACQTCTGRVPYWEAGGRHTVQSSGYPGWVYSLPCSSRVYSLLRSSCHSLLGCTAPHRLSRHATRCVLLSRHATRCVLLSRHEEHLLTVLGRKEHLLKHHSFNSFVRKSGLQALRAVLTDVHDF